MASTGGQICGQHKKILRKLCAAFRGNITLFFLSAIGATQYKTVRFSITMSCSFGKNTFWEFSALLEFKKKTHILQHNSVQIFVLRNLKSATSEMTSFIHFKGMYSLTSYK